MGDLIRFPIERRRDEDAPPFFGVRLRPGNPTGTIVVTVNGQTYESVGGVVSIPPTAWQA